MSVEKELDILLIKDYIGDLKLPKSYGTDIFKQISYSISFANELMTYILANESMSTVLAINRFASKMDYYACNSSCIENSYMFSVGYDIAEDILSIFL